MKISLLVAEISDVCLLGVDFLKKVNLENVFDFAFATSELRQGVVRCSCIK